MYIPFLAKQKANAWQLAVLPCVFGMLFYYALQSMGNARSTFEQLAIPALLGGAVALLSLALAGGLRACGMGLCLLMAGTVCWAFYVYWREQKTQGADIRWLYVVNFDKPMAVLSVVMSAYVLVCFARLLLPMKRLDENACENFRSFFRIAGLGLFVFQCLVMFYAFFLSRVGFDNQRGLNLIPLRMLRTGDIIFLGNMFLFFPLGFFLRGLFGRRTWLSIAICAAFSLLMEICQWVFSIGRSDINDLLLNTLGGAMGVLTVIILSALRKKITMGEEDASFLAWGTSKTVPSAQ